MKLKSPCLLVAVSVFTLWAFKYFPCTWTILTGIPVFVFLVHEWTTGPVRYCGKNKAVLVTGCDSGFGHQLALSLSQQGVNVFAVCLETGGEGAKQLRESNKASNLHILKMDVAKMEDVVQAKIKVQEQLGNKDLWGIVNNAGILKFGDIELITMDQLEQVLNVNFLGTVRVTKAFLPLIRKSKGRIVNMSSVRGIFTEPYKTAYSTSKAAVESFTDSLRMEMQRFGVDVSVVQPCQFGGSTGLLQYNRIKTDFDTMWARLSVEQKLVYDRDYIDNHLNSVSKPGAKGLSSKCDTSPVIDAIEDALFNESPRTRYLVAGGSKWIDTHKWKAVLKPILPDRLMDKLVMAGN